VEEAAKALPDTKTVLEIYRHDLAEFVNTVKHDVAQTAHDVAAPILPSVPVSPEEQLYVCSELHTG